MIPARLEPVQGLGVDVRQEVVSGGEDVQEPQRGERVGFGVVGRESDSFARGELFQRAGSGGQVEAAEQHQRVQHDQVLGQTFAEVPPELAIQQGEVVGRVVDDDGGASVGDPVEHEPQLLQRLGRVVADRGGLVGDAVDLRGLGRNRYPRVDEPVVRAELSAHA